MINRLIIGRFLGGIVAAMDRKCELLRRAFTRANCCISGSASRMPRRYSPPPAVVVLVPTGLVIELHFSLARGRIRGLSGDERDFRGRGQ